MNYPIESLTYIAPSIFIVLMIAFPVIGVFGGWKRAVYWGGGNFLFYVIGLLIWTFAGEAIISPLKPLITKLLEQAGTTTDLTNIIKSVLAPVFFIIVLFLANILLVINYYAWYKRVVGLKKYKTVEKKNKDGTVTKVKVRNQVQLSTTGKIVNMVVGGVAMTALMLPTTFAFTEAVSMTTTSYKTRQTNKLSSGVHNAVVGTDMKMNWFSYYSGSAKDFDALFGTLGMMNNEIEITLPNGEPFTGNALDALGKTLDTGIGEIYKWTTDQKEWEDDYPTKTDAVLSSADNLIQSWNGLMNAAGDDMTPLFNSDNATAIVKDIIGGSSGSPEVIDSSKINNYIGDDSAFAKAVDAFQNGGSYQTINDDGTVEDHNMSTISTIDINQECYDNIVNAVYSSYQFDDSVTEEQKQAFHDRMDQLINILFV